MTRALVILFVLVLGRGASAQPWAQGVTEAQKTAAQQRLEEGNALFLKQSYKEALDKYQEAIASWDHPAIRFNIVRCLILLDRPVDASDNLQAALKYGADPLDDNVYREALGYQKLLANEIAMLEVTCAQPGVRITLDGQDLMTCPGTQKRRVAPGKHGVVATKEGFMTEQLEVKALGGAEETVRVELIPLARAARVVHRWPTWIPWVVFGGGLVVGGVGGMLEAFAVGKMNDYDRNVARDCMDGCDASQLAMNGWTDDKKAAERLDKVAISVIAVGVVGTAVGAAMLVMNRGTTVYEDSSKRARLDFVPRDGGGVVTLGGRF